MDVLLPLISFAFVSSITPGPNNVMLSASGVSFGLRRTLPHLAGVSAGFATLLGVCGAGIGRVVVEWPAAGLALKGLGSAYLLYLAWNLREAFAPGAATAASRPLRFAEAAMFQFVNPKVWIMALTAVSVFVPDIAPRWLAVAIVCVVFVLVGLPCILTWAALGVGLRRFLHDARARRLIGLVFSVLLAYTVVVIWV